MWIILWILSLILVYFFMRKRQKQRIDEIILHIDKLNCGDYSFSMKQDEFSILEDKIYKLFLKVVEERENTKRLSKMQIENLENIAHQIKTPITTLLLELQLMDQDVKSNNSFIRFESQLNRLNDLSDILLKLSSLDANIEKMKFDEFTLGEVFDYVIEILEPDIERKKVTISKDFTDYRIKGDFYWICEAFINILKNSINLDKVTRIWVSTKDNPIFTQVTIEDDGGGIALKRLSKIFERFYKTPDSKGFGIGLSMAKSIITSNNGAIEVLNGKSGAIFKVKFYK
ncbi:HAMP domain-containing sensor histidine kinase [Lagierella sp.]|uniref:sensor histidine kinase n=1 Tax=Lagierella sp. TaxID=2849657 RepID=UPI00260335B4|nr:HAMP domain-containing sensor histidine kinase [Lagierella sp.]